MLCATTLQTDGDRSTQHVQLRIGQHVKTPLHHLLALAFTFFVRCSLAVSPKPQGSDHQHAER